jgi:ribosome-associated protein
MLIISPALVLDERHLEERFVRASGPGGKNVNKVATAVELRFDVAASSLPDDVKARLAAIAGQRLLSSGHLLIQASEHRTQQQNRESARRRLVELIRRAERRPKHRRQTKPTAASRQRRLESKERRSRVKRLRARKLDD